MNRFFRKWLRCFIIGFHTCVACLAVLIVIWLIYWAIWTITGETGTRHDVTWWECMILIALGVPLLGYFISSGPERLTPHPDRGGEVRQGKWRKGSRGGQAGE